MTRDAIGKVKGIPLRLPGVWKFLTIAQARTAITQTDPNLVMMPRDPSDPPCIVESWI